MEIFLFFFISSIILVFSGRFFLKIFYKKKLIRANLVFQNKEYLD